MNDALLKVKNVKKHFPVHGGIFYRQLATVYAVDGVSFEVRSGETLGVVGESGCGKTTVGRTIIRLYSPTSGEVWFDGQDLSTLGKEEMCETRRHLQMIFQDPYESLNPRHSIEQLLEEPFVIHRQGDAGYRRNEVRRLLEHVGLAASAAHRYPHEFSGGQRQRVGIARAISQNPKLIVCDEPVSALDVSIQSQILNLLLELQAEMNLAYVFIAHDLAVVKHVSDRIAVMYLGKIVEFADAEDIYAEPLHPYTRALISSIPEPDPQQRRRRQILVGDVPSPLNPPPGCRFHTRCPHAKDVCRREEPELAPRPGREHHSVACHFAGEV